MITEEVDTVDKKKLYEKIHRIRTKLGKGRHQLTITELDEFITVHFEIPANTDTPYIIKSEVETNS